MPIPGVTFEWDDQSDITPLTDLEQDELDRPIYLIAAPAAKGPEEWQHKVFGQKFFDLYGTPDFRKYGQASIQAGQIIREGGLVTFKRVVASDSLLANLVLIAHVEKGSEQDTDANGIYIWQYIDPDTGLTVQISSNSQPEAGVNNIPAGVTIVPSMVDSVEITYKLQSYTVLGNNLKAFEDAAKSTYSTPALGNSGDYPLAIIADMGRGVSNKRFRIYKDDTSSYPVSYYNYIFEVIENDTVVESIRFSLNPDVIEADVNIGLQNAITQNSNQVRCRFFQDIFEEFVENIQYISGISISSADPLFGYNANGSAIAHFTTNATPLLDTVYGNPLVGGSNGSFGDYPAQLDHTSGMNIVDIALKAAYSGNTDDGDDIYDVDNNRIDCIFDANYHQEVKRAIEQLVNFREDCIFFRDFNDGVTSIQQMKMINQYQSKSRFCASYMNSYDIYDPYTRKQITVTVTYHLALLFVDHFINGRNRPFCGQRYGIIIPNEDIVAGTLNFSPKRTPREDQRRIFDDLRINYLSYYDGNILTMNTEYVSQTNYTQLSWINNVLSVQEVIKAIRALCPKIRYSFIDGNDLVEYRNEVQQNVINRYQDNFQECTIEYATNTAYDQNKLIYAVVKVRFRNFVQSEYYKITALS